MDIYEVFKMSHVLFTIAALLSGLIAIIVNPKGGEVHKKQDVIIIIYMLVCF